MAETFNPNPTPKEALEETLHTNAGTGDIATLARALLRISEEYHRLLRSEGKTGSVFETGRKTGPVDTMPRNVTFIPPQEIENMNRSSKEHERQARWAEYWAEYQAQHPTTAEKMKVVGSERERHPPLELPMGEPKQCFENAGRIILHEGKKYRGLKYCEGYPSGEQHAWIEDDATGILYEVTRRKSPWWPGDPRKDYVAVVRLNAIEYKAACEKLRPGRFGMPLLDGRSRKLKKSIRSLQPDPASSPLRKRASRRRPRIETTMSRSGAA